MVLRTGRARPAGTGRRRQRVGGGRSPRSELRQPRGGRTRHKPVRSHRGGVRRSDALRLHRWVRTREQRRLKQSELPRPDHPRRLADRVHAAVRLQLLRHRVRTGGHLRRDELLRQGSDRLRGRHWCRGRSLPARRLRSRPPPDRARNSHVVIGRDHDPDQLRRAELRDRLLRALPDRTRLRRRPPSVSTASSSRSAKRPPTSRSRSTPAAASRREARSNTPSRCCGTTARKATCTCRPAACRRG